MTAKVAEGIAAGFFDDGPRMERLDVLSATRYLDALELYERGGQTTRSWARAFEAAAGLLVIRARESNDVRPVIEVLDHAEAPDLATVESRLSAL